MKIIACLISLLLSTGFVFGQQLEKINTKPAGKIVINTNTANSPIPSNFLDNGFELILNISPSFTTGCNITFLVSPGENNFVKLKITETESTKVNFKATQSKGLTNIEKNKLEEILLNYHFRNSGRSITRTIESGKQITTTFSDGTMIVGKLKTPNGGNYFQFHDGSIYFDEKNKQLLDFIKVVSKTHFKSKESIEYLDNLFD